MSGVATQTLPDLTGQTAFDQGGDEVGTVLGVYLDNESGPKALPSRSRDRPSAQRRRSRRRPSDRPGRPRPLPAAERQGEPVPTWRGSSGSWNGPLWAPSWSDRSGSVTGAETSSTPAAAWCCRPTKPGVDLPIVMPCAMTIAMPEPTSREGGSTGRRLKERSDARRWEMAPALVGT